MIGLPNKRTIEDKQLDNYRARLILNSINPVRIEIIKEYKAKQKRYLEYLKIKSYMNK